MEPKYKIGQEVWCLMWGYGIKGRRLETNKNKIINIKIHSMANYLYDIDNTLGHYEENCLHLTENELLEYFKEYDIFISSKNCYLSELKYKLRELKLKRILNET